MDRSYLEIMDLLQKNRRITTQENMHAIYEKILKSISNCMVICQSNRYLRHPRWLNEKTTVHYLYVSNLFLRGCVILKGKKNVELGKYPYNNTISKMFEYETIFYYALVSIKDYLILFK